jgi:hypothetical protein
VCILGTWFAWVEGGVHVRVIERGRRVQSFHVFMAIIVFLKILYESVGVLIHLKKDVST